MDTSMEKSWVIPRVTRETTRPTPQETVPESKERLGKQELSLQELSSKVLLTLEEANRYTGLGLQKLRDITNSPNCQMVLWNGSKRMIKRRKLEEFLNAQYSI